jgi:hypothetical protein
VPSHIFPSVVSAIETTVEFGAARRPEETGNQDAMTNAFDHQLVEARKIVGGICVCVLA